LYVNSKMSNKYSIGDVIPTPDFLCYKVVSCSLYILLNL